MSTNNFSDAASHLLKARVSESKTVWLAASYRPHSVDDALAIQTEMIRQRRDLVGGWKCLLPPTEKQQIVAPIFSGTINTGPYCKMFADNKMACVEPEIAFVLASDLPPREQDYTAIEIDNALSGCYMALELMQDRFQQNSALSFYEKLADCLVNQGLYLGPEVDRTLAYKASNITINVTQNDKMQSFAGQHPNQLPQNPLYWLINFMSKRGVGFKAGQAIISGSYAGIIELNFDCPTEIEYVGLGKYTVEFNAIS